MIQATYSESIRALIVRADPHYDRKIKALPGVRKSKGEPQVWQLPVDLEILRTLEGMGAQLDAPVVSIYERLLRIQQWVEQTKDNEDPQPLHPPPIKDGYNLYKHQVRAYNLTLGLFGYITTGEVK